MAAAPRRLTQPDPSAGNYAIYLPAAAPRRGRRRRSPSRRSGPAAARCRTPAPAGPRDVTDPALGLRDADPAFGYGPCNTLIRVTNAIGNMSNVTCHHRRHGPCPAAAFPATHTQRPRRAHLLVRHGLYAAQLPQEGLEPEVVARRHRREALRASAATAPQRPSRGSHVRVAVTHTCVTHT